MQQDRSSGEEITRWARVGPLSDDAEAFFLALPRFSGVSDSTVDRTVHWQGYGCLGAAVSTTQAQPVMIERNAVIGQGIKPMFSYDYRMVDSTPKVRLVNRPKCTLEITELWERLAV